jgi:hypothetical protein
LVNASERVEDAVRGGRRGEIEPRRECRRRHSVSAKREGDERTEDDRERQRVSDATMSEHRLVGHAEREEQQNVDVREKRAGTARERDDRSSGLRREQRRQGERGNRV